MVEELDLTYWSDSDYEKMDFSMFSFVKKVALNENESLLSKPKMKRISSQIAKMRRLKSLDLEQVNWGFIEIITKNKETQERTKSLSVKVCDGNEYQKFRSSIPGFKHLEFLKVCLVWGPESAVDSDIKSMIEMCSNLKGLDFRDTEAGIGPSILQKVGHQLQYLKLHDSDSDELDLKEIDFANLLELQQGYCKNDSMRAVLKTAVNLEKVQLKGTMLYIEETLTKCQRLRYLEIDRVYREEMEDVLDALERGLFRTKKQHRDALKIRIDLRRAEMDEFDECIMKLDRIANGLTVNPVDHWMIILDVGHIGTKKKRSIVKDLRKTLTAKTVVVPRGNEKEKMILITNPGCAISGWRESWLMNV